MPSINTAAEFLQALADGPYAWPGGYPLYFLCSDGGVLSFKAAEAEQQLILNAITDKDDSGWRVVAVDIKWEDENLYCDHTGEKIESAYTQD